MRNDVLIGSEHHGHSNSSGDPTVAVAFGGGGARGVAHIHIIEVLDELGIRPVAITGASIGAIMGTAMAAGMSGREVRAHALHALGRRSEVVSRIWRARPYSMGEVMSGGFRLGQFNIERILAAFLPRNFPTTFDQLQIPTQIVVTDFYAQQEAVRTSGDLINAVAASAAIPALFRPVLCDGRYMIDGGICNPVPFDYLTGLADIVIGIDVVGGPSGDDGERPSTMDLMFGASQLMMQSIISMKLKSGRPDIFLRPDVNRFRVLDFFKADEILAASAGVREELKHAIDAVFTYHVKGGG
ncbi:patatin-like phospholipase family protein [Nitratireductor sp. XY-223]|uniref:patatin-like phospholipase family protein n=1 Tax=Nitratireductor sp. XY-223 TaxID=2561926 RepID=UPI0010AB417A|nr:patatin-like phospholipase family protein [Nitratireductor sp. XY-223]